MSLAGGIDAMGGVRFPRVSGDEPLTVDCDGGFRGFSPRERG